MKKRIYLVILFLSLFPSMFITSSDNSILGVTSLSALQALTATAFTEDDFMSMDDFSQTTSFPENYGWKWDTIINASDYSGENDTERLQAALNDVPPEGAVVLIPSGVWVASGLTAKSNTTILGMNGTVIQRPDNTTIPFITFENASNFAILNLTFNGNDVENSYGITISNGKFFTIENCIFLNIKKNAIRVNISLTGTSEDFTIVSNTFLNSDNAPILIFGQPTKRAIRRFMIANNTIINGTVNGKIGIAFSSEGMIVNNTVLYSQFGIATRCISNITIKGNIIKNSTDYGIYLGTQIGGNGTDNVLIENNVITENRIGIARYYGSYSIKSVRVINNQFVNNTLYDIFSDFPATYINNTVTSTSSLIILDTGVAFIGTRTIAGNLIIPGDINFDHQISIFDIAIIAKAYGSREGSASWNPEADVIKDFVIDLKDISYTSKNYGFTA